MTQAAEKKWYVVQVYAGMERSVERLLRERIEESGLKDAFGEILLPKEEVVEVKNGQKTLSERKFFPGYILLEVAMSEEAWHLVKKTSRVNGFIGGSGHRPSPIPPAEVEKIRQQMQEGFQNPRPKTIYEVGQEVRIKEGAFADFGGYIEDVNYEKSRLQVSVAIFGRVTPVDVAFSQVEKV